MIRSLLLVGVSLPALYPLAAQAQSVPPVVPAPVPKPKPPARPSAYRLTLPLIFDGSYQGDVPVLIGLDGTVKIDAERLIALLGRRVSPDLAIQIRAAAAGSSDVPLDALPPLGVNAVYDAATLELKVSIPIKRQGTQSLSIYDPSEYARAAGDLETPSNFSASAIVTMRETYRWKTAVSPSGFDPLRVAVDFAANVGGEDGVSLFAQGEYNGEDGRRLSRGNVILIHDDVKNAIRYSAGDVAVTPAGFQTAPTIGGVSIERQYGTLQPFRNVRPSGQLSFLLEKPSVIDVVVNGAVLRTIRLEAGQYNLRDFPFFNGLNEVELYVVDAYGRRLLTSFSQYFTARLLDKGIFEFGANAGLLERPAGNLTSRYRTDRPSFSGFARYGITDNLTMGVNAQGASNQRMGGVELGLATKFGTIGALASFSSYRGRGTGSALLLSYEVSAKRFGPFIRPQLNLEAQKISRGFTPLTLTPQLNRYSFSLQGRFASQLPGQFGVGVSFLRLTGRDLEPNENRYAATVSKRIWRLNLTGSYEAVDTIGPRRERRFLLTATLPIGRTQSLRSSYDTRDNQYSIEYAKFQRDEIGTLGGRATITRGDSGISGSGELDYIANRFSARAEHNVISGPGFSSIRSQETSLTLSTQIAYAGGKVAIGRPVGARFAIVSRHPTLGDATLSLRQGPGRDKAQAKTDVFGPALAPAGNAYTPTELRVDADRLPPGYDIGPGQYYLSPGVASGYAITVGSDASRVVIGTAVDEAGNALTLQGGTMLKIGDAKAKPILVFTNRSGRFVATGLAPGRYELTFGANGDYAATVTVPEDSQGTVTVGTVKFHGKDGK